MADVELIIKIDESKLWSLKNEPIKENFNIYELASYIDKGTPLPKGHGALKDTDKIISDGISKGFCDWYDEIKYADTIIEADKAEK